MKKIILNPPMFLAGGFFLLILIGTAFLALPVSQQHPTNWIDCLFTATSAVCVTGLVTVTTASTWTTFGHVIIILLIQIGGLGVMAVSTIAALLFGKRITLSERLIIQEQTNSNTLSGMVKLMKHIFLVTFTVEAIGAVFLSIRFVPQFGWITGIWYSIFHSISSFCNAGFDILGDQSLINYQTDSWVLLTIATLIILGGIGFSVITNVVHRTKKLELHTKIALTMTVLLLILGTLVVFFFESTNPKTLEGKSLFVRLTNSFFQSTTLRTAGYAALDQEALLDTTSDFGIFLMFVGGSPAGCAGGIKTTTFALLLITALSEIRGNEDVEIFQRRIHYHQVRKAMGVFLISAIWVYSVSFIIMSIEPYEYMDILYEVTSAFATVGVTKNLTPLLSRTSQFLLISSMYLGRVGILSFLFAISKRTSQKGYKEAYGYVMIG